MKQNETAAVTAKTAERKPTYPKEMVVFPKNGHWKPKYYTLLSRVEERLFRSWAYFDNQHVVVRAMRKEAAI